MRDQHPAMEETMEIGTNDNGHSTQPTGGVTHVISRLFSQKQGVYGVILTYVLCTYGSHKCKVQRLYRITVSHDNTAGWPEPGHAIILGTRHPNHGGTWEAHGYLFPCPFERGLPWLETLLKYADNFGYSMMLIK